MVTTTKELLRIGILFLSIFIFMVVALVLCVKAMGYLTISINEPYNQACKNLGFIEQANTNDFDLCRDKEDNLHFVKFNCTDEGFNTYCSAKEINVGKVKVIDNMAANTLAIVG